MNYGSIDRKLGLTILRKSESLLPDHIDQSSRGGGLSMFDQRKYLRSLAWLCLASGCAGSGGKSLRPPNSLAALKKQAREEAESPARFSRKAVSDAEMLQGHSAQEYRDAVVP